MVGYISRRIALAIPVLIGILLVVFVLARMIPGDPCRAILGEKATVAACERFNEANGLNESIPVQLGIYMRNFATGDFGDSIRFSRPVGQITGCQERWLLASPGSDGVGLQSPPPHALPARVSSPWSVPEVGGSVARTENSAATLV